MPVVRVSRRDVVRMSVLGGVVAALAGCTSSGSNPTPPSPGSPEDPDRALRAQAIDDQRRMTALYAAADVPSNRAAAVADLSMRHQAYATAINPSLGASVSPGEGASAASASPAASVSPSSAVPALGLRGLRKAELESSAVLVEQAGKATDPELARVLILAAAGSAAAAEALRMVSHG